jgi:pimeloyl-ACP methyl ester carboxylesterase
MYVYFIKAQSLDWGYGVLVLVHGAWHGAWCWDAVVVELGDRGVPAAAVELPLTGFRDDVATVRQAIQEAGDEVVVCAHSYGGMVVSTAARGVAGVRHLVFLAAFQTDEGEDMATLLMREPSALTTAMVIGPAGVTVDPSCLHEVFYGDSDPSVVEGLAARLRPMPLGDPGVMTGTPAWKAVPSTYVICARDNAIAPATQRFMAARAGQVVEWDSDHSPFFTRPGDVADLLASRC